MKVKLGEVCVFQRGQSITKKDIIEGDIPVVAGGKQPAYYHNKANRDKDIITVSSSGANAGYINFWTVPIFSSDSFTIKPKNNNQLFIKYIYYFLKSRQEYLYTLSRGCGIPHIYISDVEPFEIILVDIQTQKEIVAVLDKVSLLISMRKEQLEKLDILVKSKFIEMFGNNIISTKYIHKINNITIKIGDGLHGTPNYDENGIYAFINGNNLDNGKININQNTKFINISEYEKLKKNITNNTILLSINGTLGKLAYYNGEEVAFGKSVCYIDLKDNINRVFFYHALNSDIFQQYLENNANKSTIKNVNLEKIRNCHIFIPPLDLQNQFAEFVEQVEKNKEKIKSSLNQLETLYSALMQEYFG